MPNPGRAKITLKLSGPLFRRDPGKTIKQNIRRMMEGLAEEGQTALRSDIRTLPLPESVDWTASHAVGRVKSLKGKSWTLYAVISANTAGQTRREAIRTMAAASSVEGRFHPFRRTTSALRRSKKVLQANLVAGLDE